MTLVKICGVTNLDDARSAIAAGADLLGFNFYRPSPRFIEPLKVREIIEALSSEPIDRPVTTIGVFVNGVTPDSIVQIVEESGVGGVQLHGDESIEFCHTLK